jgi:hypothetical protein
MKKAILLIICCFGLLSAQAQGPDKYILSGGEIIFSFADISGNTGADNIVRFSPVFNAQAWRVYDWSSFGLFHGLAIRNVGFIADFDDIKTRVKFRTYNLGIPVGAKLNLGRGFAVYAGYEFEIPFVYKQKTFENEEKTNKFTSWFSDRTPTLNHGLFAGFQFRGGMNLKFKYYVNDFFNADFEEVNDGVTSRPYENFNANVFYIAITFNAFRNLKMNAVWEDDDF